MPVRRTAIVTGGNRGIGLEIARRLMKADTFVVVGCRTEPKCALAVDLLRAGDEPGMGRTDMGGDGAPRSVEEGAETAVWLCLLPSTGPTGEFFRDRKPIPW